MLIDRILIKFITGMQNASAAIFSNGIRKLDVSAVRNVYRRGLIEDFGEVIVGSLHFIQKYFFQ